MATPVGSRASSPLEELDELQELWVRCDDLNDDRIELEERVIALQRENGELEDRVTVLENQNGNLADQVAALSRQVQALDQIVRSFQEAARRSSSQ